MQAILHEFQNFIAASMCSMFQCVVMPGFKSLYGLGHPIARSGAWKGTATYISPQGCTWEILPNPRGRVRAHALEHSVCSPLTSLGRKDFSVHSLPNPCLSALFLVL